MDVRIFRKIFQEHKEKLSEAWLRLSDKDLERINGDLNRFTEVVSQLYQVPPKVILRELDAVYRNIQEGINTDYAPRLDPKE